MAEPTQDDIDKAMLALVTGLKEVTFKNDRTLLNLIKALIEKVNRLEQEFLEYRGR